MPVRKPIKISPRNGGVNTLVPTETEIAEAKEVSRKLLGKKTVNAPTEMTVNALFKQRKETKGAVVYAEVDEKGDDVETADMVIGQLYVRKTALPDGPAPRNLSVTVTFK